MPSFECRLKKYRKQLGLTQGQLAQLAGTHRETIGRVERARHEPSLKMALNISHVVGAPVEELFIFRR